MAQIEPSVSIKNRVRIAIHQRRYSGSRFWKYAGYAHDALSRGKSLVVPRPTMGILIENHQAIFFYVPKVASTSLLRAFSTIAHGREMSIRDVPKLKEREIAKYQDYYKFAIVRNPYDRLVSCYHDKVLVGGICFGKDTNSFVDFVPRVCSVPDKHSNIHFRSQHEFITGRNGNLWTDYVGKFEKLDEEYDKICRVLGVRNPPVLNRQNKSNRVSYKEYYNEQTKRLVMERYQKDIDLFDYEF